MTLEEIIISAFRLFGALLVLRWALLGSITAIAIDLSDLFLMNLLDLCGVRNYQSLDKWLDLSYMFSFAWVALRWQGAPKTIALIFLFYRIIGVGIFEVTGHRDVLIWFPNLFEFWVVFYAGVIRFKAVNYDSFRSLLIMFFPFALLKEFQEYALHGGKWLDQYRAVDVVRDSWSWIIQRI